MADETGDTPTTATDAETAAPEAAPKAATTTAWGARIDAFAAAVGKKPEEITNALTGLTGEAGDAALEVLSDPNSVEDGDLKSVLVENGPKIPLGVFRKNLGLLRGPQKVVEPVSTAGTASFDVLPSVPDDGSFLEMLKVGGVLKPQKAEVISAIKAALASKCGLFELPKTILEKMEAFADEQDEPVGAAFYDLRKTVVSRSYAEVLSVLGIEGSFVSEGRKKAFLAKVDTNLWNEVESFYGVLVGWQDSWTATTANPAMALTMLAMAQSGGPGVAMPPGMMTPPETAGVRDAAEAVIDKINKVFSGVGVPIARAMAYDATRVKAILEDPGLPVAIGSPSREHMLKTLGVSVGSDYVRLERNLTRFVLAVMELPSVPSGNEEYGYLGAMLQLGASIPWDKLSSDGRAGIGKRRNGSL